MYIRKIRRSPYRAPYYTTTTCYFGQSYALLSSFFAALLCSFDHLIVKFSATDVQFQHWNT